MSLAEIIGTVLGVIGVWLMIRQHIWNWPVGLVQVAVYAWVFYDAKLYSDAILQGAFFVIQAYGWWHWARGGEPGRGVPVTTLRPLPLVALAVGGGLATMLWGGFMHRTTDAAMPWADAFILVFSLIAQWLQARKKLENWPLWMIVNTVAMAVYWLKDLRLTAGLYGIFWVLALWGWREWQRARRPRA